MKKTKKIYSILDKLKRENEQNKRVKIFNDLLFLDLKTYENIKYLVECYGWEKLTQSVPEWRELCRVINDLAEAEKNKDEVFND